MPDNKNPTDLHSVYEKIHEERRRRVEEHKRSVALKRAEAGRQLNILADGDSWFSYPLSWDVVDYVLSVIHKQNWSPASLATEFPDLKVEQRTAPCSNGMRGGTARRVLPPGMKQFPIGHCHKQGYELIIPDTDLQWMGGKKP